MMLKPGEVVDNATLSELFAVANSGGMRRSLARFHLVLVADWTKRGVRNRWRGGVLHYTGMGSGDQLMSRQNLTLARSPVTGERVHLLEVHEPGAYTYRGQVELAGEPYRERQPDASGAERDVWMFPLRLKPAPTDQPQEEAPRPAPRRYLPRGAHAVVMVGDMSDEIRMRVDALLQEIRELGVEVHGRTEEDDAEYRRGLVRWAAEAADELRRLARKRVREVCASRERAGVWAFAPDEVEIDHHAGDERVREVLDLLGVGDEFDRLRERAEKSARMPASDGDGEARARPATDVELAEIREHRKRRGF